MGETGTGSESRERRLVAERRALPDEPGVYLFRDRDDEVIYVGKARSIRKRVGSHFSGGNATMTSEVDSIEFLATETESEALIAEQNFIKRYRPRFNVRLRDDKSYPYIAVSLDEAFPRVYFTRERHRAGRAYFGPFSSARRVRETLDLLGRLFQFRTCDGPEPGRRSGSPCLDYFIDRCGAPCVGYVDEEAYRESIDGVLDFLSGRYGRIEEELERQMEEASAAQDFEKAAAFRDRLEAVRSLFERQRVSGTPVGSADLIGVSSEGADANAQVFQVRDGVLLEKQGFYLEVPEGSGEGDVAAGFIERFYATSPALPRTVLVGPELSGRTDELAERLSVMRDGSPVELRVAERGEMRRLREMAERNARLALGQEQLRREFGRRRKAEALSGLAEALGMEEVPVRIEGFDISNLGGQDTVASMVVFEGGTPKKSDYRRFKVSRGSGPDDYASLEEVLGRRMARYEEQVDLSPHDPERDQSFASLPGLILIDGGKGQLSSGLKALGGFLERGVTVIGLAKRHEEVFLPGSSHPAPIRPDSEASLLLQRVRDEAHRFAIGHHRGRRSKRMTESVLDGIRGVGPERKRLLLRHFGSPDRLAEASREELEAVPGLPGKVAREVYEQLHRV
ncbi:MAG: excinuclease ABC subunit UvrC [Solirubrobacterales bacterium]